MNDERILDKVLEFDLKVPITTTGANHVQYIKNLLKSTYEKKSYELLYIDEISNDCKIPYGRHIYNDVIDYRIQALCKIYIFKKDDIVVTKLSIKDIDNNKFTIYGINERICCKIDISDRYSKTNTLKLDRQIFNTSVKYSLIFNKKIKNEGDPITVKIIDIFSSPLIGGYSQKLLCHGIIVD